MGWFQKNLVVWKLISALRFISLASMVSEELSSVETGIIGDVKMNIRDKVSEELSSVETIRTG